MLQIEKSQSVYFKYENTTVAWPPEVTRIHLPPPLHLAKYVPREEVFEVEVKGLVQKVPFWR